MAMMRGLSTGQKKQKNIANAVGAVAARCDTLEAKTDAAIATGDRREADALERERGLNTRMLAIETTNADIGRQLASASANNDQRRSGGRWGGRGGGVEGGRRSWGGGGGRRPFNGRCWGCG